LEKSWNFHVVIFRPGKVREKNVITKVLEKSWKFVVFTCSFTLFEKNNMFLKERSLKYKQAILFFLRCE